MKKYYSWALFAFFAFMSLTLTSCDGDDDYWYDDYQEESWWNNGYKNPSEDYVLMSNWLRGHWTGTTKARYYDENGILVNEVLSTDMEFDKSNANAIFGRGQQKDYNGDELVLSRTFSWRIDNRSGDIYIVYEGYGSNFSMTLDYDDLYLDQKSFSGILVGEGETDEFSYTKYTFAKPMPGVAAESKSEAVHFGNALKK